MPMFWSTASRGEWHESGAEKRQGGTRPSREGFVSQCKELECVSFLSVSSETDLRVTSIIRISLLSTYFLLRASTPGPWPAIRLPCPPNTAVWPSIPASFFTHHRWRPPRGQLAAYLLIHGPITKPKPLYLFLLLLFASFCLFRVMKQGCVFNIGLNIPHLCEEPAKHSGPGTGSGALGSDAGSSSPVSFVTLGKPLASQSLSFATCKMWIMTVPTSWDRGQELTFHSYRT